MQCNTMVGWSPGRGHWQLRSKTRGELGVIPVQARQLRILCLGTLTMRPFVAIVMLTGKQNPEREDGSTAGS